MYVLYTSSPYENKKRSNIVKKKPTRRYIKKIKEDIYTKDNQIMIKNIYNVIVMIKIKHR